MPTSPDQAQASLDREHQQYWDDRARRAADREEARKHPKIPGMVPNRAMMRSHGTAAGRKSPFNQSKRAFKLEA